MPLADAIRYARRTSIQSKSEWRKGPSGSLVSGDGTGLSVATKPQLWHYTMGSNFTAAAKSSKERMAK